MAFSHAVCLLRCSGGSLDTFYTLHVPVLYWCSSTSAVRVAGTAASGFAVLGCTSANAPIPTERVKAGDLSSLLTAPQLSLPGLR